MDEQNNYYQDNTQQLQEQPGYQISNEPESKNNVLAIVSMALGISSILACCTCFISILLGIAGIICSVLSKKDGKSNFATAGLICSIIGIVLSILFIGFFFIIGVAEGLESNLI
jgi:ABC-type dipeptide/oligopeptide/nickel transport system permease component